MKTDWTDGERLQKLFAHYNGLYWNGRLKRYAVSSQKLDGIYGICDHNARCIRIDIEKHKSDREVRSTLLHEMCHAAAGRKERYSHGSAFCEQLEMLLRAGAPITINFPEFGNRKFLMAIPKQFKLVRKAFKPVEERYQRAIQKRVKKLIQRGEKPIDFEDIVFDEVSDWTMEGASWRQILFGIGEEYGLCDIDNRPHEIYQPLFKQLYKTYRKARRQYLEFKRAEAVFRKTVAPHGVNNKIGEENETINQKIKNC
ncbi:SprT-like domain-containing protein [bacterium]|nr:SprT-like domain-containing protein [bacterium]